MYWYNSVIVAEESNLQRTINAKNRNQVLWLSTKQNTNLGKSSFSTIPDGQNFPEEHIFCNQYCKHMYFFSNKIMSQIIPIQFAVLNLDPTYFQQQEYISSCMWLDRNQNMI